MIDKTLDFIEEKIPDSYPSCVVTRATVKVTKDSIQNDVHVDEVNFADTRLSKILKKKKDTVLPKSDLSANQNLSESISKFILAAELNKDPKIPILF